MKQTPPARSYLHLLSCFWLLSALIASGFAAFGRDAFDLPFTRAGSYLAVDLHSRNDWKWHPPHEAGIWIRSASMFGNVRFMARIVPLKGGEEVPVSNAVSTVGRYRGETPAGNIEVTFADEETLLVRAAAADLAVRIDCWIVNELYQVAWEAFAKNGRKVAMVCLSKNGCKAVIDARSGTLAVDCDWNGLHAASQAVLVSPDGTKPVEIAFRRCRPDWDGSLPDIAFESAVAAQEAAFAKFIRPFRFSGEKDAVRREAARLLWGTLVSPAGSLTRPAMLMSKNWMTRVWSWDCAFNAVAMAPADADVAWDQLMVVFDLQDASGKLPDCVSDGLVGREFTKPPIHGWALRRMREKGAVPPEHLAEIYPKLAKWTRWWLDCRDRDGNGLCEYEHGNDSGWDNGTAFLESPSVESPELQAFLVVQMDVLAECAEALGRPGEAVSWRKEADALAARTVATLFDAEGRPRVRRIADGRCFEPQTLMTRLSLLMGRRLPERMRARLADEVASPGYLTPWGLATEALTSPHFGAESYWRGPVWAPATMLAIDALAACGRRDLADEVARRFCRTVEKSGFAENFNPQTGEGLCDPAYTWAAAVYLILKEPRQ